MNFEIAMRVSRAFEWGAVGFDLFHWDWGRGEGLFGQDVWCAGPVSVAFWTDLQ